jgi:hypothetical protein
VILTFRSCHSSTKKKNKSAKKEQLARCSAGTVAGAHTGRAGTHTGTVAGTDTGAITCIDTGVGTGIYAGRTGVNAGTVAGGAAGASRASIASRITEGGLPHAFLFITCLAC